MKKRRIIIISCIAAVLIILIGVFSALFRLKDVKVEVLTNSSIVEQKVHGSHDDIIKSADFNYGSNMLFSSYDKNIQNIEKANPFLKVEKMVRSFPNKLTIYVSGRIPEAIICDKVSVSKWYVVDAEMKVLDVVTSSSDLLQDLYKDLPFVNGAGIENVSAGDFAYTESTDCIRGILDGIYGKDKTPPSVMSDITIDLTNKKCVVTLDDRDELGAKIVVNGFENMKYKIYAAYYLYVTKFETDDLNYLIKSGLEFRIGSNFVPVTNERVTVFYDGEEFTDFD